MKQEIIAKHLNQMININVKNVANIYFSIPNKVLYFGGS